MDMDASAFVADPGVIEALSRHLSPFPCDEDRVLFNQGDMPIGLYVVHGGEVLLSMKSLLGEVIMRMRALPGSLLGLPGLIGNTTYSLSALARSGAEVSFIGRELFEQVMMADPTVAVGVLRVLAAEVRSARSALGEM